MDRGWEATAGKLIKRPRGKCRDVTLDEVEGCKVAAKLHLLTGSLIWIRTTRRWEGGVGVELMPAAFEMWR